MPAQTLTSRSAAVAALALATLAATATTSTPAADAAPSRSATVVRTVDGDDLVVRLAGARMRLHLAGIAAPSARRCFSGTSAARLRSLLPAGTRVRVRRTAGGAIVLNSAGADVARLLVSTGHARALKGGGKRGKVLRSAQAKARRDGRGLFSRCSGNPGAQAPAAPGNQAPGAQAPAPADQPRPGTAEQARSLFTGMLEGVRISAFESSYGGGGLGGFSSETTIDFCPDGTFSAVRSFSSSVSEPSVERDSGRWSVTVAQVQEDRQAGTGIVRFEGAEVSELEIGLTTAGRASIGERSATAAPSPAC
jgi:endonuclease YncB( thermonuclease family)